MPIWSIAWADQDALRSLDRWSSIIEAERIARTKSWLDAKPRFDEVDGQIALTSGSLLDGNPPGISWYDRCRFVMSSEPFSITGLLVFKTMKIETQKNLVVTAIALKRFDLRHGEFPTALSDLVPDFLSEVPRDCIDDKPLRYRQAANRSFLLYSVGADGKDNGGDSSLSPDQKNYRNLW
ncbi:MAG: hypothetical protein ACRD2L_18600, partial [Terriglobia bacterium]